MASGKPVEPDEDGRDEDLSSALDAAIRQAFDIRLEDPVPPDVRALIERVRALEARARKSPKKRGG